MALAAALAAGCAGERPSPEPRPQATPHATPMPAPGDRPPPRHDDRPPSPHDDARVRFLAAASGAFPADTQISLEQDLALVQSVLAGPGRILLAAGPGAAVLAARHDGPTDPVRAALRDLFVPDSDPAIAFRAPRIAVDGPADRPTLLAALAGALARGDGPLLVFLGGHGEQGAAPADNRIVTWGGDGVSVAEIADALAQRTRPVLLISSACFSGGLAATAARSLDEIGRPPVCGLFAAPWDREATGCDPNPDRTAQDGFALHFFSALAGRRADGTTIPAQTIDLDGDGRITPLEAHAFVRAEVENTDVPTTSSATYALDTAPVSGPTRRLQLPVEAHVVQTLAQRLGVVEDPRAVQAAVETAQRRFDTAHATAEQARLDEDAAFRSVAAELLSRWPGLDDPWRDDFEARLRAARPAVEAYFEASETYRRYRAARKRSHAALAQLFEIARREAMLDRLARARATLDAVARLAAADPDGFARFETLRRCEATPVALRAEAADL